MEREEKLKFSIFHLDQCAGSIDVAIESIAKLHEIQDTLPKSPIWLTLAGMGFNFVLIKLHTFFEEYENHFLPLYRNKSFGRSCKPIVRAIKDLAPDYKEYRHQVAAHPMRKKDDEQNGEMESLYKNGREAVYLNPYKIPSHISEYLQLRKLILSLMEKIHQEFPELAADIRAKIFPPP